MELRGFLINQIYDVRETKTAFIEAGTKIKQLLHDLQAGRDYTQLREQLASFIDRKQS